jgi:uroporphyrinogen-III decarboxylase
VSKGWLNKEGNFSFLDRYYFDPLFRWNQDRAADLFIKNKFPDLPIYNMESNLVQAEYFDPSQILIGGIQPNMLVGMAVGAKLNCFVDKDPDIDSKPLEDFNNIHNLPNPKFLLESEIMILFNSQLEIIKNEQPDLKPIPPFFWDSSGRATIHGLITTAQKLFGEKIFIMMLENFDFFSEILSWITEVYIIIIKHYASLAKINISSIHIGECSGEMISGEQFINNILPFINRFGEEFKSVRLHSCGFSDHLIEGFSKVRNISTIDTGSGTSISKIRSVMGNTFKINLAPPVEFLTGTAVKNRVFSWLDKTIEENVDGPLQIAYHIEPDYSMTRCLQIFDYLAKKGISIKRI